jgi:hypothetical protein
MGSLIKELLRPRHSKMAPVMPNLFKTFLAPADYIEPVNTLGLPRYAKATPSHNNKSVRLEMQANPLSLCERPARPDKGSAFLGRGRQWL